LTTFIRSGCFTCHTYLGSGARNLGAPDLSAEARRGRGRAWQIRHLKCPGCLHHGSPMPKFAGLSESQLERLATFLEQSKGRRR
jgi:mono/diheme cytochrome c family protein